MRVCIQQRMVMASGLWLLLKVAHGGLSAIGAGDSSVHGCFSGCRES